MKTALFEGRVIHADEGVDIKDTQGGRPVSMCRMRCGCQS